MTGFLIRNREARRQLNDILIEFLDYILWLPKSEFAALMLPYKSNVFGGTGIEGLQLLVVNQWKEIFTVF